MRRLLPGFSALALLLAPILAPQGVDAQKWTHRYPQLQGYGHHVYVEGYELPTLAVGPLAAAPAPDGRRVAFQSRGWIWLLELEGGVATRLTRGGEVDARPAWSPDGTRLALVRDTGRETYLVILDAATGEGIREIRAPALLLDPVFSPDGESLYYSSAREGTPDLWRMRLDTGEEERITSQGGIQLRPQPHPDGVHLLYLSKAGGRDQVRLRHLETGEEWILLESSIASQARPALSPDGRSLLVNWPVAVGWELHRVDLEQPTLPLFLARGDGLPLAPAWSPDGAWAWFSHPTPQGTMALFRIPAAGGEAEEVEIRGWDWGEPTGRLRIRTVQEGEAAPVPARLGIRDARGHPALPERGQPRFDGENGRVFVYSPGVLEVELPAGDAEVLAVQGFATPLVRERVTVEAGGVTEVTLTLAPLWDAAAEGWLSGDHHFHLNYGGPFQVAPAALAEQVAGEALDAASPLLANLHHRFGEREFWSWRRDASPPFLAFGQEVRSHFLGHVALVGTRELFWPWIWGPGYPIHGEDDRPNADALRFGRDQGGMGAYVHPVSGPDPFTPGNEGQIPVGFIADAVLGEVDALEVVCLWSDDLGTAELWYRILNLGIPLAATAGSDVMTDFYRTMAVGATRVFVHTGEERNWTAYLQALREGRSFVSTGPFLDFRVGDGVGPGGVVPGGSAGWTLDLRSPTAVEWVEIVVNGRVVETLPGPDAPGRRSYSGRVTLPDGGWMAVRARGGAPEWPVMAAAPFAHTSPVWIGSVGSRDDDAAARSATELLRALDVAEDRLRSGYAGVEIPRLQARFDEARRRLEGWAATP